ncbi:hypothetical protein SUGI_0485310 [Cryptomeria japonica]|nr:hypothetical protein SUGI_0485310 [Cryptomeria japonica]
MSISSMPNPNPRRLSSSRRSILPTQQPLVTKASFGSKNTVTSKVSAHISSSTEKIKTGLSTSGVPDTRKPRHSHHQDSDTVHSLKNIRTNKDPHQTRTIHVSNVHHRATEEDIRNHFSACGEILTVIMLNQISTGVPTGGANLEFATREAAQKALILNGSRFMGRALKISSLYHSRGENKHKDLRLDVLQLENQINIAQWKLDALVGNIDNSLTPSNKERAHSEVQSVNQETENNVHQPDIAMEEETYIEYYSASDGSTENSSV